MGSPRSCRHKYNIPAHRSHERNPNPTKRVAAHRHRTASLINKSNKRPAQTGSERFEILNQNWLPKSFAEHPFHSPFSKTPLTKERCVRDMHYNPTPTKQPKSFVATLRGSSSHSRSLRWQGVKSNGKAMNVKETP